MDRRPTIPATGACCAADPPTTSRSRPWVSHWFDPDRLPVRLMLVGVMLASLFMSVTIPEAFGERGLAFGVAIAVIHVGRAAFAYISLRASDRSNPVTRTFQHTLAWHAAAGTLWVAGGLAEGRPAAVPAMGGRAGPQLRRPRGRVLRPGPGGRPHHRVGHPGGPFHRALPAVHHHRPGESLLVTGAAHGAHEASVATTAAFLAAWDTLAPQGRPPGGRGPLRRQVP